MQTIHFEICAAVIDRAAEQIEQSSSWETALPPLLAEMGTACAAVEVALFRTRYNEQTIMLTDQDDTWRAHGSSAAEPLRALIFSHHELNPLMEGQPVVVTGAKRPANPAGFWLDAGYSVLALPIQVNRLLWGIFRLALAGEIAQPDKAALSQLMAAVNHLGLAVGKIENQREEAAYQVDLAELQQAVAPPDLSVDERISRIMTTMLEKLALDIAIISHIEGDRYTVEYFAPADSGLSQGQIFDLGITYCSITMNYNRVIDIPCMELSEFNRHPCYTAFNLESYIGAVLQIHGERYGTLNFSSVKPRPPFTKGQRTLVQDATRMVQALIESI